MKMRLSLQWQLTIMTALLMSAVCLLLSFFISHSALFYMDEIGDSVIAVFPKEMLEEDGISGDIYLDVTGDLAGRIRSTQVEFWTKSLLITLLIVFVSSCLTYFIVGYALRPLRELGSQVEEIREKNMQQPVSISNGSLEIRQLTDAFNGMLERLSEAFFVQRQFSANAAHELRTPLAVMQTRIEVLDKQECPAVADYSETLDMIKSQTQRLSHVIDMLLEMTELNTAEKKDRISMAALTEEVLCDLEMPGKKKGITLSQTGRDVQVMGSDTLIYRALYNLVENAIKYNRENGSVTVDIQRTGPYAEAIISDTGPGIKEENWEKIFEPFFRVDKSRSRAMGGAGLGLALVRRIAELHGGDVSVVESSEEGTKIRLRLLRL